MPATRALALPSLALIWLAAGLGPVLASDGDRTARHAVVAERDHGRRGEARESVYKGYGGPTIEHHFGIEPCDPCRPRNRHYYPYVYGGYGFSAPYYVSRHDYEPRRYDHYTPYGWRQKRWWGRDARRPDRWEGGRW